MYAFIATLINREATIRAGIREQGKIGQLAAGKLAGEILLLAILPIAS
jgi:hypothetical protein